MYILSIVRYDINHGEMDIFRPIKATTESFCEDMYINLVEEDKQDLLKDYEHEDYIEDNFEYSYRIDKCEELIINE